MFRCLSRVLSPGPRNFLNVAFAIFLPVEPEDAFKELCPMLGIGFIAVSARPIDADSRCIFHSDMRRPLCRREREKKQGASTDLTGDADLAAM
jgi:hypothetical protein